MSGPPRCCVTSTMFVMVKSSSSSSTSSRSVGDRAMRRSQRIRQSRLVSSRAPPLPDFYADTSTLQGQIAIMNEHWVAQDIKDEDLEQLKAIYILHTSH